MQGQQLPVSIDLKEIRGKASREDMDMGGMQVRLVVGNGKAYVQQGDMRKDAPPEMRAELQKALFRDPNFIVINALAAGREAARAQADDRRRRQLRHARDPLARGRPYTLLLDPKTHQLAKLRYIEEQQQTRDDLGDYRIIDGVSFPFKLKHESGGKKVEIQYDKITVNPKLAPDLFQ